MTFRNTIPILYFFNPAKQKARINDDFEEDIRMICSVGAQRVTGVKIQSRER